MKSLPLTKKYQKSVSTSYFLLLTISYAGGAAIFVFLKMLGLEELSEIDPRAQQALLPLSICMGLLVALGLWLMELSLFIRWKHLSFGSFAFLKYGIITCLQVAVSIFVYVMFAIFIEQQPLLWVIVTIPDFLKTEIFISIFLYLILLSLLLNTVKTIADYLGPQTVAGALMGKYDKPIAEDLTFIFIDLSCSTSTAEMMGHARYSQFIGNCFRFLTESIHQYEATIYQFVGDEAVLVWPTAVARKSLAPVDLYFDFMERLEENSALFLDQFGQLPHFRASVHSGQVTVTQIHTLKRDIVYHGDVLNTCARILEQSSKLQKDMLISYTVASWLDQTDKYKKELLGELPLRGKSEHIAVYQVSPMGHADNATRKDI